MAQMSYGDINDTYGRAGELVGSGQRITHRTSGGATADVWTVVVSTATDAYEYIVTTTDADGNSTTSSHTAQTSSTTTTVATGIAAAINANPVAGAYVIASSSTATVTVTARSLNYAFTLSHSEAKLAAVTHATTAAEAASIYYGVGVIEKSFGVCTVPNTTDLPFKVMTATPGAGTSAEYALGVRMLDESGHTYWGSFTGDGTDTVAEAVTGVVASLNGVLEGAGAGLTVAATDSTTHVTVTGEQRGIDFELVAGGTEAACTWTFATTTADGVYKFLGVAKNSDAIEQNSSSVALYTGRQSIPIVQKGRVWVRLDASINPTIGDPVYCRHTAGATEIAGAFRDAVDSTDSLYIPNARWCSAAVTGLDGANIAQIELL